MLPMTTEAFAPAKINLTLHVTGQRSDSYHLLDSLVVFGSVGDRLWLAHGDSMSMEITGPFAQGVPADARNLVWRAAEVAGVTGHITLEKNLPHGAGLGGGSADAAALLRSLYGDRVTDGIGLAQTLALGADVPVCMSAVPQRMRGIGGALDRIWPVPELHIVLANPRVPVPTSEVFTRLERKDNRPMAPVLKTNDLSAFTAWLGTQRNDLQSPAIAFAPVIGEVLDALQGALIVRMSGSGSTCFGIYPDAAAASDAASRISAGHPDWWVVAARTVGALPS